MLNLSKVKRELYKKNNEPYTYYLYILTCLEDLSKINKINKEYPLMHARAIADSFFNDNIMNYFNREHEFPADGYSELMNTHVNYNLTYITEQFVLKDIYRETGITLNEWAKMSYKDRDDILDGIDLAAVTKKIEMDKVKANMQN